MVYSGATVDDDAPKLNPDVLRIIALVVFMLVVGRRGWICDDAFISLRVVDNFVNGYGLTFNPDERVMGFTNPLWVLLLSIPHAILREPYGVCMGTSLVVALAGAIVLAFRVARDALTASIALVALAFTQAYGDFSTSGLENPLGHLLVIGFLSLFLVPDRRIRRAPWAWLLVGLMLVNRLDEVTLLLPAVVVLFRKLAWRRSLKLALIGLSPLLLWEVFAVIYYGFPLPNTAIAKLNVDMDRGEMIGQGVHYLFHAIEHDPLTALLIAAGVTVGLSHRDSGYRAMAFGTLLHLAYITWVAGDFMAGRFLSMPLAVSVCLLLASVPARFGRAEVAAVAAVVGGIILVSPHSPFVELTGPKEVPKSGIANERDWYLAETGLGANLRRRAYASHAFYQDGKRMAREGKRAEEHCNAGLAGYAAGPGVHLVDLAGLTDAFLARLEFKHKDDWRTAHYGRPLPRGYLETLRTGQNQIEDPKLHAYYDKIALVVRGPVFSGARLQAIFELNTGAYDHLVK